MAGRPGRRHLSHVEGLRAIAALVVYVNHAYAQAWSGAGRDATGLLAPVRFSMIFGHLAVSVFRVVISGFASRCLVVDGGDRIRGGSLEFFKRRARRILPPYYGALALSLALIYTIIGNRTGTLWDVSNNVDAKAVVAHLVLVQDLFRTGRINYAFWSIAVEWQIYFLFPLLVWGARRFGVVRVAGVALVVGYALRFGLGETHYAIARESPLPRLVCPRHAGGLPRRVDGAEIRARPPRVRLALARGVAARHVAALSPAVWGVPVGVSRFPYLDFLVGVMAMAGRGSLVHATSSPGIAPRALLEHEAVGLHRHVLCQRLSRSRAAPSGAVAIRPESTEARCVAGALDLAHRRARRDPRCRVSVLPRVRGALHALAAANRESRGSSTARRSEARACLLSDSTLRRRPPPAKGPARSRVSFPRSWPGLRRRATGLSTRFEGGRSC